MHRVNPGKDLGRRLRETVHDERVLAAIESLPRDRFVPEPERHRAYENVALPIACEQTISQPLVVARMLELLELTPSDRVLDVGTGSGYHAALLAMLAGRVYTLERHAELSAAAHKAVIGLSLENVEFFVGDGWEGLPELAPFDAINVAAAPGDAVPAALESQLAQKGRLVAPIGSSTQHLTLTRRTARGLQHTQLEPVRFVPLVRGPARS